jgi:NAD(P)-dependent dehydrogenase (short-subunit alcohol dehydrogenase family)
MMGLHLVVGSSGLVGRVLVDKLAASEGGYVLALDNQDPRTTGDRSNVDFIEASITNKTDLDVLSNRVNEHIGRLGVGALSSVTFLQASAEPRLSREIPHLTRENKGGGPSPSELRRELWRDYTEADLLNQFRLNLGGTQNVLQAIYSSLVQSPHVSIVFLSSVFARVPLNQEFLVMDQEILLKPPGYSSSKSALENYSKFLMGLFQDTNCRFNCISPGPISMTRPKGVNKKFEEFTAGNTLVDAEDVVNTILLLHSEQARSIRGSVIEISNGWGGF